MSRMNPSIILSGQQPDFGNALAQGQALRMREDQMANQNALRNLYQTQGAGILAGDPAAMNALAQFDPGQAVTIQGQHQLQSQRAQLMKQEVEKYAQTLTKEQREAEAAQLEQGITRAIGLYQAGNLDGVNQILQSVGEQPLQSLDQFPAIAALYGDALSTLKSVTDLTAPEKPADEYGRYVAEEEAAGRTPLSRIEYKRAGQKTQRVNVGSDGSVSLVEGFGETNAPPKMTVDAAKNTGFLIRLKDAQQVLNDLEAEGLSFFQQNAENIPLGLGNYFVSEEFQRFDQARRDFVNAILRRESGAVISDQEFDNAEKQYFPMPGDSKEVIAQKRRNRKNAIAGVRAGSGEGAGYADQLRGQEQPTEAGGLGSQPSFEFQNDQQRLLFEKYAVPSGQ